MIYSVRCNENGQWLATCDAYPALEYVAYLPVSALAGLIRAIGELTRPSANVK